MTQATLSRMVRDHRTGQVHLPHEPVAILGVRQNLGRTLIKIKWPAGGRLWRSPRGVSWTPDAGP